MASIGPTTNSSTPPRLIPLTASPPLVPAIAVAALVAHKVAAITGPKFFIDCLPITLAALISCDSDPREHRSPPKLREEAGLSPHIRRWVAYLPSGRSADPRRNTRPRRTSFQIRFARMTPVG